MNELPPKTCDPTPPSASGVGQAAGRPSWPGRTMAKPGKGHTSTFSGEGRSRPSPGACESSVPTGCGGGTRAACDLPLASRLRKWQHLLRRGRRCDHSVSQFPALWDKRSHSIFTSRPGCDGGLEMPSVCHSSPRAGGFGPTALFRARVCPLLTQPPAGKAACSVPRRFTSQSLEDVSCAVGAATPAREASDKQGTLCLHGTQARFHTAPQAQNQNGLHFQRKAHVLPRTTGHCSCPHPTILTPTCREKIKSNGPGFFMGLQFPKRRIHH